MLRNYRWSFVAALALLLALLALGGSVSAGVPSALPAARPVDAAAPLIAARSPRWAWAAELNMHAAALLIGCGQDRGGNPPRLARRRQSARRGPRLRGADILVNNAGADTFPNVTQDESTIAAHGQDVVVSFFSSSASPGNRSGLAVSHDGGDTYTDLRPSPLSGQGINYGKVSVVYNPQDANWYASALAAACGGQGVAVWKSTNGDAWSGIPCGHSSNQDDSPTLAVDRNSASPYYGRLYLSWNDFTVSTSVRLDVSYSTNGGASWAAPIQVTAPITSVVRNVQLVADRSGTAGTLYLFANNENGGGLNDRTHLLYRSTNGGTSWTQVAIAAAQPAPGDDVCSVP